MFDKVCIMDVKRWLAIYTKPRWEKKIYASLISMGINAYCPLNKVRRKWSDRIKLVEEPLFKSYVFVRVNSDEEEQVKRINGVLNFIYWLGKPAVIRQIEIDRIRRFLNDYEDVHAEVLTVQPDDMVVITSGALMESQAKVLRRIGKKVELEITGLGYKLVAYVDKKNISVLNVKKYSV